MVNHQNQSKSGTYAAIRIVLLVVVITFVFSPSVFAQVAPTKAHPEQSESLSARAIISPLGQRKFAVDRRRFTATLDDLSQLSHQGRVIPTRRAGEVVGLKFFGIRPSSLLKLGGLESGDLLIEANRERIDSLEKGFVLFKQLRHVKQLNIVIERQGKEMTLRYLFR